ncbi:MAG: hypothetical protein HZA17_10445 [Nitrospirae bacterium]|nr:hypothetical protein [Nitrospirota bacterium]
MKRLILIFFLAAVPLSANAEFKTIDQIAKAYDDDSCKTCHEKAHKEWQKSFHSQSVVHSLGGLRNFIVHGVQEAWKQPVSKEHLMRCMDCHAPQLLYASESVVSEVVALILTANDEKDAAKKASARNQLSRLNVGCVVCHNTKASIEKNLKGAPQPGVFYGPTGRPTSAHGTAQSPVITSAAFCGQCHGIHTPPDGDFIGCNTLYGSYQDAYRGNGGLETCQDCHMRAENRGHTFPGAYDAAMVKNGIGVDVQAIGFRLTPGTWTPVAVVNVSLINRAGHRIPDG